MTKQEQHQINTCVLERVFEITRNIRDFANEHNDPWNVFYDSEQLYYCQATVTQPDSYFQTKYGSELPNVIILTSYSSVIAIYDCKSRTLFDFLRYSYGYTATSQRHIERFIKWLRENGCAVNLKLTWKKV